jgi:hypothetical protein
METVLMEERKLDVRRKGRNNSYRFDQEQEDPLMSIGTALLYRSAFGRVHVRTVRNTDTEETDYGASRDRESALRETLRENLRGERSIRERVIRGIRDIRSKRNIKCSR